MNRSQELPVIIKREPCPSCGRRRLRFRGLLMCCSRASAGRSNIYLSDIEFRILDALRFATVLSIDDLLDKVYLENDREMPEDRNAVRVYIHRIKAKLEGSGVTVAGAQHHGYMVAKGKEL